MEGNRVGRGLDSKERKFRWEERTDEGFKKREERNGGKRSVVAGNRESGEQILRSGEPVEVMRIRKKIYIPGGEWFRRRGRVMRECLRVKWGSCENFRKTLLDTGSRILVEDTDHEVWARGRDGQGENMLGRLLMNLRDVKLREIFQEGTMKGKNDGKREGNIGNCVERAGVEVNGDAILFIGDSILMDVRAMEEKIGRRTRREIKIISLPGLRSGTIVNRLGEKRWKDDIRGVKGRVETIIFNV